MKGHFFSIDEVKILGNTKDKIKFYFRGWSFFYPVIPFKYEVYKDNKKVENIEVNITERIDVQKHHNGKVQEKNLGFEISFSVDKNFKTIDLVVAYGNRKKILETFYKENLPTDTILYNIEESIFVKKELIVRGWAFSKLGNDIEVIVNGEKIRLKEENRPDVLEKYQDYKSSEKAGFSFKITDKKLINIIVLSDGVKTYEQKIGICEYYMKKIKRIIRKIKRKQTLDFLSSDDYYESYDEWFLTRKVTIRDLKKQRKMKFEYSPKVSIVVPTYRSNKKFLKEMIESLILQTYSNWELCIADGNIGNLEIRSVLENYVQNDERIKVKFLEKNFGISGNTNEALKMATGDYIGLLDHDDLLCEDTLFEIIKVLNTDKTIDIIYTDEDKVDYEGNYRINPHFKPDWSPDLLKSYNYITHFLVFNKNLIDKVGNFRAEFDGAQDYDMILRLTEEARKIYHIPKVLYHWREHDESTSINPDSKPYAHIAGLNALKEHVQKKYGNKVEVKDGKYLYTYSLEYNNEKNAKVSIIIPTKDGLGYLKACVESILELSTYKNYDIIILNNNSENEETYKWFEYMKKNVPNLKILDAFYEFNWSKLNNNGIKESDADVFIFLNNDTKIITPNWIEIIAENALRDEIGTVGVQLLYEDDTIQHAGVVVGMCGWAEHVFKGEKQSHMPAPFVSPMITRNVLASTGACLGISRKTLDEIGLFNEEFIICGSDVELSIRAYKMGKYNLYISEVQLYHYESKTRDNKVPEIDFKLSKIHYYPYRETNDPFYNKNLDKHSFIPKLSRRKK